MIWLTWRYYWWMVALGILALGILIPLFSMNVNIVHAAYQQPQFIRCLHDKSNLSYCALVVLPPVTRYWYPFVTQVFPLLPFVVGVFIGAPLLAKEYERRTYLFVWTQSVSRTRWLSINLIFVAGTIILGFGVLSLVTTWWAFAVDEITSSPWSTFMIRGSVLVANALFCLMFGVMVGAIIHRVLLAMLVTFILLIPLQVAIANAYPYLYPPSSQLYYNFKIENQRVVDFLDDHPNDIILTRVTVRADGKTPITDDILYNPCPDDKFTGEALAKCNFTNFKPLVTYHRFNQHFWPLQMVTTALLLALATLCSAISYWQVLRLR